MWAPAICPHGSPEPGNGFAGSYAILCQHMVFRFQSALFKYQEEAGCDLQVATLSTAILAAPISDALARQASRGFVGGKGPVAYSIAASYESDSSLIPAANTQWLQGEHSRSSIAPSVA